MKTKWTLVDWPYSSDCPKCWMMKIKGGKVYLREDKYFNFTVSCGANSDRSFSGCFFGLPIKTLDEAKKHLELRAS